MPITPPLELAAAISVVFMPEVLRGDHLQVSEQRVGGRVAAGEEDAQPAEQGAEEREHRAGRGEAQAQGSGRTGVVHQEREPQHDGDGQFRIEQLPRGAAQHLEKLTGDSRRTKAERMDATRQAVPAAESQSKLYFAS